MIRRKPRTVLGVLFIIYGMVLMLSLGTSQASLTGSSGEFGLKVEPSEHLFQVDNFAPGDSITRELTVQNIGEQPFPYIVTIKGEESLLLKQLDLKIDQGESELFAGKMSELGEFEDGYDCGYLSPGETQKFTYTIFFPPEPGNEYQNTRADFDIVFYAEGNGGNGGDDPGNGGGKDPGNGGGDDGREDKVEDDGQTVEEREPEGGPGEDDIIPGDHPGGAVSPPGEDPSIPTQPGDKGKLPYTGGTYWGFVLGGICLVAGGWFIGRRVR